MPQVLEGSDQGTHERDIRVVKSSALRTWLRRERAREHRSIEAQLHLLCAPDWDCVDDGYWREPRADVHIHGRDCAMCWWELEAGCDVEGEYPRGHDL